jgi:hypothetical protein
MTTLRHFNPFHARATGEVLPVLLLNNVPTARHDVTAPQEILYPLLVVAADVAAGRAAAAERATDGVTAAEAFAVRPGTAMPAMAASATSPDSAILRTKHPSGKFARLRTISTDCHIVTVSN